MYNLRTLTTAPNDHIIQKGRVSGFDQEIWILRKAKDVMRVIQYIMNINSIGFCVSPKRAH